VHTLFDCVTVAGKYVISYAYRLTVCIGRPVLLFIRIFGLLSY